MNEVKRDLITTLICCIPLVIFLVWLSVVSKKPVILEYPQQTATEPTAQKATQPTPTKTEYGLGDTWLVDGQWFLTITSVTETDERNPYSDKTPQAVYIVSYSYENIGYEDETGLMDGLYFSLDGDTIVDSAGEMGYSYPADVVNMPKQTPVGAHCNADVAIGVNHAGQFSIIVNAYDGNRNKQSATFKIGG